MRFLIAAVLVLSCATARSDDIHIWGTDLIEPTAQLNKQKKLLITTFQKNLSAKGHKVVKEWEPHTPQIGFMLIADDTGTRGVAVTATNKSGALVGMSFIPIKGNLGPDWVTKMILQKLGL